MIFNRRRVAAFVVIALITASPSAAQVTAPRSSTAKVFIGAALNGSSIKPEGDSETESGSGLTLQVGYGFTPKFSLFIEGTAAEMSSDEPYSLAHFDFGARYHFSNPARALVPYLEAALTGRAARQEDVTITDDQGNTTTGDLELSGAGFSFGGGVLYFLNSKWALNGGLKWTVGEFSTVKFGNVSISGLESDATTARVNLGISWFPKGG